MSHQCSGPVAEEAVISVENISKVFKLPKEKNTSIKSSVVNFWRRERGYSLQKALDQINVEIKKGEFFGIIGRNGSGKSTLLKLLAGIYMPTKGSIRINGSLTPFIELGVGFNPELTGRENIFLNGALLGFNRKEMQAMYKDIVSFAELERFMDQKLKNYSSGMQVRLAFSIAIRARSDILLIDEVLAVGDQSFQEKCYKTFEEVKKRGTTVVFISHDGGAIQRFCDRVAIINRGQLVDIGKPREMVMEYGAILAKDQYESRDNTASGHSGTGEVEIAKVEIKNLKDETKTSVKFGEPFSINVRYRANHLKQVPVVLGVSIIDDQGVTLLDPNTEEAKLDVELGGREGSFKLEFDSNPLSPGTYSVAVGIFNDKATFAYDLVEKGVEFKIIGNPRGGKIYIKPRWSLAGVVKK